MTQYIRSLQNVALSLNGSQTSNTATITSVNTNNILIIYQGSTQTGTITDHASDQYTITVTNSTTLTITRGVSNSNTVTAEVTVIEFISAAINTATQTGTIVIGSGSASNTATINTVGSNAAVVWLGQYDGTTDTNAFNAYARLDLTNSTTVTATREASPAITLTVAYLVIDLTTTLVRSVQTRSYNSSASGTSFSDTITSIAPTNTILLFGGLSTASNNQSGASLHYISLTSATTVNLVRGVTSTASRTVNYTVIEFQDGILNRAVQRGIISLGIASSNTATITSVNIKQAVANWCGYEITSTAFGANNYRCSQVLTNATTVTTAVNTSSSSTAIVTSYEVIEFNIFNDPLWFGMNA